MPEIRRVGRKPAGTGPSPAQVGEQRAFIAREGGRIDHWDVVGGRRLGYDVHGAVVADLPARTTHRGLPHVVMYRRRQLTDIQFAAAELLRRDLEAAGSWSDGAIDWSRVEEALHFRRPGGSPRLRWPPRRPSSRVRRSSSGYGPPGGGDLDARRRIVRAMKFIGFPAAHLVFWVVAEARTCAEWTVIRNAGYQAEANALRARAAVLGPNGVDVVYFLNAETLIDRAEQLERRRLDKHFAPDLLRDGLDVLACCVDQPGDLGAARLLEI